MKDNGSSGVEITYVGELIDTMIDGKYPAVRMSVYNSGMEYVYCSANSTLASLLTRISGGLPEAVCIAPKAAFAWTLGGISSMAVATQSGKTTTIDWAIEVY